MPYTCFHQRVPHIGLSETRSVMVQGDLLLPEDEYGFLELYCDDSACDCRRVLLWVTSYGTMPRILATISYGWESVEYYEKQLSSRQLALESSGASLDPFGEQTEYSRELLALFRRVVLTDFYRERLKKHYRLCKDAVNKDKGGTAQKKKKHRRK
jgi:hypothetical protein